MTEKLTDDERAELQRRIESLTAQCQRDFELAAEWKAEAESARVDADVARDKCDAQAAVIARVAEIRMAVTDITLRNALGEALAAAPEHTTITAEQAAVIQAGGPLPRFDTESDTPVSEHTAPELSRLRAAVAAYEELTADLQPHDMLVHWRNDREQLAEANARVAELEAAVATVVAQRCAALARADAAELEQANLLADYKARADECDTLESEAASLRAELAKALRAYDDEVTGRREEVTMCHAEMGKLRAEVERLRREPAFELGFADGWLQGQRDAPTKQLESHLSTATELLRHAKPKTSAPYDWEDQCRILLSTERGCVHNDFMRGMSCDECRAAPTEREKAERAVLEAMRSAAIAVYHVGPYRFLHDEEEDSVCKAELALRAVKG
jgi:hypothetical protein